jgi:transposase InsO family protein
MLEANGVGLLRLLTDRGTEFCGRPERHDYQLYLAVNDIEHTRTKAYSPQTNGICERFHRTVKEEFYEIALRKCVFRSSRPPSPRHRGQSVHTIPATRST